MYIGAVLEDGSKHITLAFCGHNETHQQYKTAVCALAMAAEAWRGGAIGVKMTGEMEKFGDFWVTLVKSEPLMQFRELLVVAMLRLEVNYSTEFAFRPHITMTKWKKPKQGLQGKLKFARLTVMSNEFGRTDILL